MNRFSAGCTRLWNRFYRSGQPSRPVNAVAKKCSTANCNNWAVTGKNHCTTHGG